MKTIEPILDKELMDSIMQSVIMFNHKTTWEKWGLAQLREQGAAMLFVGDTGTGKTTTARWLAKHLKMGIKEISMAEIGSGKPGDLARNVQYHFQSAQPQEGIATGAQLILLDECDTVLISRKNLVQSNMWMLEPINALLVAIRKFKGLCILCTNAKPEFLDSALQSRLLGTYEFGIPKDRETRVRIWESKWPAKFPVKPTKEIFAIAETLAITAHEVELILINWASNAIQRSLEKPLYDDLIELMLSHPVDKTRIC